MSQVSKCPQAAASDSAGLVVDGLLTVAEAAAFLRLSRATLYQIMDRGELPFVKLGRSRRIPKRALVELAAAHLHHAQGSNCYT